MADNLKYNEPGSGPLVATDDVNSVQFQKIKLDLGGDGASLPVNGAIQTYIVSGTSVVLGASSNNIGDVDILSLPNEGQQSMANSISVAVASDQSNIPVSATNLDIRDLSHTQDTVSIGDGTDLALVTPAGALVVDGSAVTQPVTATDLDIRNLSFSQDNVVVSGTLGGLLPMGAQFDDTSAVLPSEDGYSPLRITVTRGLHTNLRTNGGAELGVSSNPLNVVATSSNPVFVRLTDGTDNSLISAGGALLVDGSAVTQPISAASLPLPTGAATSAAQLPDGHNVTVDNAAGGSAVNIQDGGNAITVDAVDLDIRNLAHGQDSVRIGDGTDLALVTTNGGLHVNIRDNNGNERGIETLPLVFSGTLNIDGINTNAPEVKFVRVNATADGDNTIITGVSLKKIRVIGYVLTVTTAGTITLQNTAGSPEIYAQFSLAANGGVSFAGGMMCPAFETAVGTGLEINNPAGVDTLGHIIYKEV